MMNRKLSDWASFAQIVSGIAVVVTLVFLVMEIREGTNVTRASMYASTLDSLIDNRTQRIESPELNRLVQVFLAGQAGELQPAERQHLIPFLQNVYQIYEKAFFSMRYGVIGDTEWARFQRIICMNYSLIAAADLTGAVDPIVSEEFLNYVVANCAR